MAQLLIPSPLRKFTDQRSKIEVQADSVWESLKALTEAHPSLKEHIFDQDGKIRPFLRLFIGDTDSEDLEGPATPVSDDDEISIIPAIAGGSNVNLIS